MAIIGVNLQDVGLQAKTLYESDIRRYVETSVNIGKMVIIDVDTGNYEIDEMGIDSARRLRARNPDAHLFGLRIGFKVAESFGGVIERTTRL